MCIGLPCRIIKIHPAAPQTAQVQINGVRRDVNISLVTPDNQPASTLVGQWVLAHVGFAMSLLHEQDALDTLEALKAMEKITPNAGTPMNGAH